MKAVAAALAVVLAFAVGLAAAQPLQPTGSEPQKSSQAKPKQKGSASAGRSAPPSPVLPQPPNPERDAAFRTADMDGDGLVSKAEAAGNETLVRGFFRADRNRDGKLTRNEYETIFHPKPARKAKAAATASAGR